MRESRVLPRPAPHTVAVLACLTAWLTPGATAAAAQSRDITAGPFARPAGIERPSSSVGVRVDPVRAIRTAPAAVARRDWWAPAASAVLPGAGQARLGQDRFVGYMAAEGFLWLRYLADRRAGLEARNQYRDLALRVSRAAFPGPKPQGNFEYYERMEHWIASGAFDTDPTSAFAPETDTTTFNGAMWLLARKTYWPRPDLPPAIDSPAYAAALAFYRRYAVPSEFQWSWRNAPLHQDVYRRRIRASNDGFRHAVQDLGAVIANHVLSTVDAYISLRLRLHDDGGAATSSVGLDASIPFATISRVAHRHSRDRTP